MRYRITFQGRKRGAIGVFYEITETVEAPDADAAVLKLYDTWEHIHAPDVEELPDEVTPC
jgi:hypothetical protein